MSKAEDWRDTLDELSRRRRLAQAMGGTERLAKHHGKRALLLDLDLQFGDAAIMLGLEPEKTIHDLVTAPGELDQDKLGGYVTRHACGLDILPAPLQHGREPGLRHIAEQPLAQHCGIDHESEYSEVVDPPRIGLRGRGVACHGRAIGEYPTPSVVRLVELARTAGLGFVSDPHTGPLHLPVRHFVGAGLPVALGQDDIEDAYYPFGRHNMLEVAFLAAHILQFLSAADQRVLLDLVTRRAAAVLGVPGHAIEAGNPAYLCIHDSERVVDLLREHALPRWVVRAGRIVAESETTSRVLR